MALAKVTIGGVDMSGTEGINWPFVTGPFSPAVSFITHQAADDELQDLRNPVDLKVGHVRYEGPRAFSSKFTIENLFLRRRQGASGQHRIQWVMSDIRYWLESIQVFSSFNLQRVGNEFKKLAPGALGNFKRAPKLQFIPMTMKDKLLREFATSLTPDSGLTPWTAYEAVKWLLTDFFRGEKGRLTLPNGRNIVPAIDTSQASDNGRILLNHVTNQPWPYAMKRLLMMAHLGMWVNHEGKFILFNLSRQTVNSPLPSNVGDYSGAGAPLKQNRTWERPKDARVYFRTEYEYVGTYIETSKGLGTVDALGGLNKKNIENVTILPQDVTDVSTGQIFQRGTIVTIPRAIELWKQDPDNPPPKNLSTPNIPDPFSMDGLRRGAFSSVLANLWVATQNAVGLRDVIWAARAAVIFQDYRTLFRLDPRLLDMIEDMRAESVTIQDVATGKRAPGTVWMDFSYITTAREMRKKGQPAIGVKNVHPWPATITDPKQMPIKSTPIAPASIQIQNKRQGLFRVRFLPDLTGTVFKFWPATFNKSPISKVGTFLQVLAHLMYADDPWRMRVLFSLTLRSPNNHQRFYHHQASDSKDIVPPNSDGPETEIFFRSMFAGFGWNDTNSEIKIDPTTGQLELSGHDLVNRDIVDALAEGVEKDLYFRFEDRILGIFKSRGHDPAIDVPLGNIRSVTVSQVRGRLESVYDASQPDVPVPFWELIPLEAQRVLFRLEDLAPP